MPPASRGWARHQSADQESAGPRPSGVADTCAPAPTPALVLSNGAVATARFDSGSAGVAPQSPGSLPTRTQKRGQVGWLPRSNQVFRACGLIPWSASLPAIRDGTRASA